MTRRGPSGLHALFRLPGVAPAALGALDLPPEVALEGEADEARLRVERASFALLPRVRGALARAGLLELAVETIPPALSEARRLAGASLVELAAPAEVVARAAGPSPFEDAAPCAGCGRPGPARLVLSRLPLTLRLPRRPARGLFLVRPTGEEDPGPPPFLAVSAALRAGLAAAGLAGGLHFFELDAGGDGTGAFFGVLPPRLLAAAEAAPFGELEPACPTCGANAARHRLYELQRRPPGEPLPHWARCRPFTPAAVVASGEAFAWLTGPGKELVGRGPLRGRRLGWYPDEVDDAFLRPEWQGVEGP